MIFFNNRISASISSALNPFIIESLVSDNCLGLIAVMRATTEVCEVQIGMCVLMSKSFLVLLKHGWQVNPHPCTADRVTGPWPIAAWNPRRDVRAS